MCEFLLCEEESIFHICRHLAHKYYYLITQDGAATDMYIDERKLISETLQAAKSFEEIIEIKNKEFQASINE